MDSRLLWGTVDMMIMDVISRGPTYGYQISQTVLERSQGTFDLKEGSLYPCLHRLESQKLLTSYWVETDEGRRRKYYKLTAAGERALAARRKEWGEFATGVAHVLGDATYGVA
ncbi:MAG: PadR family transcriptional regulator [Candidatus Sumerlaeia bacterium]